METTPNSNILAQVRKLMPGRSLSYQEARAIIERQTLRLLTLTGINGPPVPLDALVARLPRITLERVSELPSSGRSSWSGSEWHILIDSRDAPVRQRFSVGHELGHIVFQPYAETAFPGFGTLTAEERLEKTCDIFAACLLMPRPWMKRAYVEGVRDIPGMAQLFGVSWLACHIRMERLGLLTRVEYERAAA